MGVWEMVTLLIAVGVIAILYGLGKFLNMQVDGHSIAWWIGWHMGGKR